MVAETSMDASKIIGFFCHAAVLLTGADRINRVESSTFGVASIVAFNESKVHLLQTFNKPQPDKYTFSFITV